MAADTPDTDGLNDEQLTERVAVEVMGWEKQKSMLPMWWMKDGESIAFIRDWNPLTNWNHTMEVAEKSKLVFSIWYGSNGTKNFAVNGRSWDDSVSLQRAICLAALQAVRSSPSA
jgi:hypothetical protein